MPDAAREARTAARERAQGAGASTSTTTEEVKLDESPQENEETVKTRNVEGWAAVLRARAPAPAEVNQGREAEQHGTWGQARRYDGAQGGYGREEGGSH